jgi:His-Xaa-Ser system protein HxsD
MKNINKMPSREDGITFEISTKIYPKEVIYKTCYVFIDRFFIYLDIVKKDSIMISLKGKENLNKKQIASMRGEFSNELLNVLLRENVSKKNQKILEYIVGGAITASLPGNEKKDEMSGLDKEIEDLKKELDEIEEVDFENDPLDIRKIASVNKKNIVTKKRMVKSTKK